MIGPAFPGLREELELYPGAATAAGSPVWIIHDPVRNRYFQIEWAVFEVLSRWQLADARKIVDSINGETALQISEPFVAQVALFLNNQQLVRINGGPDLQRLALRAREKQSSWLMWLIHHYLFIRIPLVRPDRFLEVTLPWVSWLYSRSVGVALLLALLIGLFLISRQWDVFKTSLVDLFSLEGLVYFLVALGLSKIAHELGHAYTAKKYGCRVPVMGIAFLVMWPMLYTDTNDTWKLASRRQRLAVAAAGMAVELSIATLATFAWAFLPPGPVRDMMFVLASTTWVSSLLINISPFMRFDGYYLLSDWLNIPNLHSRSFRMGRWWLREFLFKLGEPPPEQFSPRLARFLIAFAFFIWLYRLLLFLGIAVVVYHFFIKVIGILLFIIEIGWFVARPVGAELEEWMKRRGTIIRSGRAWLSGLVFAALIGAGFMPWQSRITAQALVEASAHQTLYAQTAGKLIAIRAEEGQPVRTGEVLFELDAADLGASEAVLAARQKVLEFKITAAAYDAALRDTRDTLLADLVKLGSDRNRLREERRQLLVAAPMTGTLVDRDPSLIPGQWVSAGQRLASVRSGAGLTMVSYISEDDVFRISPGRSCRFYSRAPERLTTDCVVEAVDNSSAEIIEYPAFASVYGGDIAVRETGQGLVPERAVYRVQIRISDPALTAPSQVSGQVVIAAERRAVFDRLWKWGLSVAIRETGF